MPKRYLISNIFNQLHNVTDSSSYEKPNKVKTIFLNNEYPKYLLDQEMKLLLNDKKPEKPEIDATLCLNNTCSNTEQYCKQLVQKMKNSIPDYNIYEDLQSHFTILIRNFKNFFERKLLKRTLSKHNVPV
jgi:hypothetical protein